MFRDGDRDGHCGYGEDGRDSVKRFKFMTFLPPNQQLVP